MSEVATVPNGAMFTLIERAARDESFDVAKFEALLRMRREEQAEQARRAFNIAMRDCQAEMEPVLRGSPNKGTGSKYAKLEDIDQQMRPSYTSHGFSVRYGSEPPPQAGWMRITCTIAHEAGYWEQNYLDSPVSTTGSQGGRMGMTPVQAVGATVTYLRRYLLAMSFNIVLADIAGEDKDGEEQRQPPPTTGKRTGWQRRGDTPDAPRQPPPIPQTDEQWRVWLTKLRDACGVIYKHEELVTLAGSDRMTTVIAASPTWAHDEIDHILAEHFERLRQKEPNEEADDDDDELPPIKNEDKLAAG